MPTHGFPIGVGSKFWPRYMRVGRTKSRILYSSVRTCVRPGEPNYFKWLYANNADHPLNLSICPHKISTLILKVES